MDVKRVKLLDYKDFLIGIHLGVKVDESEAFAPSMWAVDTETYEGLKKRFDEESIYCNALVPDEKERRIGECYRAVPEVIFSTNSESTTETVLDTKRFATKAVGIIGKRSDIIMKYVFGGEQNLKDAVIYDPAEDSIWFGDTGEIIGSIPFKDGKEKPQKDMNLALLFIKLVNKRFIFAKTSDNTEICYRMLSQIHNCYMHPVVGVIPTAIMEDKNKRLNNDLLLYNHVLLIENRKDFEEFKNDKFIDDAEEVFPMKSVPSHYYWTKEKFNSDDFDLKTRVAAILGKEIIK